MTKHRLHSFRHRWSKTRETRSVNDRKVCNLHSVLSIPGHRSVHPLRSGRLSNRPFVGTRVLRYFPIVIEQSRWGIVYFLNPIRTGQGDRLVSLCNGVVQLQRVVPPLRISSVLDPPHCSTIKWKRRHSENCHLVYRNSIWYPDPDRWLSDYEYTFLCSSSRWSQWSLAMYRWTLDTFYSDDLSRIVAKKFTWWFGIDADHLDIELKIFGVRFDRWIPSWYRIRGSDK